MKEIWALFYATIVAHDPDLDHIASAKLADKMLEEYQKRFEKLNYFDEEFQSSVEMK